MESNKEKNHAERAHALISPSSVYRTVACPSWIAYSNELKEQGLISIGGTSAAAAEGTLAHEVAEIFTDEVLTGVRAVVDEDKYDSDMIHYGKEYSAFIGKLYDNLCRISDDVEWFIEKRVKLTDTIWGTADFFMYGVHNETGRYQIVTADYKYGKGVEVFAEDNAQAKTYSACVWDELGRPEADFHMFIYQPRVGERAFDRWGCDSSVIGEWADKLIKIEKTVKGDEQILCAGEHCRFCPATPVCKTHREYLSENAVAVFEEGPPPVEALSVEQLVNIQEKKKAIEHYLKSVETHLMGMLERGEEVPGYKLVKGRSVRKWNENTEEVAAALRGLYGDEPYRKTLITIGEVEKRIGKGKDAKAALEQLTYKTEPKLQLAHESDKRAEVTPAKDAIAAFD